MKLAGLGRVALVAIGLMMVAPAAAKQPQVGDIAPDFTVTLLDGSQVTRADLVGQVVVINYWATWCGPCKAELPLLDAFYAYQREHGMRVFAVTTEDSLPMSKLKPLAAALTLDMVLKFKGKYGIMGAVPTNYIIDRSGHIRYAKAGAFTLDDLNALLVPLLSEGPPARPTAL
jgi:cytochrome c biogenesis protein CcmG, thiol:disulfide interchange protein DsbE